MSPTASCAHAVCDSRRSRFAVVERSTFSAFRLRATGLALTAFQSAALLLLVVVILVTAGGGPPT